MIGSDALIPAELIAELAAAITSSRLSGAGATNNCLTARSSGHHPRDRPTSRPPAAPCCSPPCARPPRHSTPRRFGRVTPTARQGCLHVEIPALTTGLVILPPNDCATERRENRRQCRLSRMTSHRPSSTRALRIHQAAMATFRGRESKRKPP
jgi:hypothetical protein